MGRAFSRVCLPVSLFVRALQGKRLELSTPNLVNVYSIAVARHELTQRSKGQRSRSHGYENRTVAWLRVTIAAILCIYCVLRIPVLPAAVVDVGAHVAEMDMGPYLLT